MLMMRAKVQGHRWVDHPAAAVMEARVPGQWVDRPAAMVMEAREQGRCWIDHPAAAVMEARVQGRHWVDRPSDAKFHDMFIHIILEPRACPVNTFKSKLGNHACHCCPPNSQGPAGSDSLSHCRCLQPQHYLSTDVRQCVSDRDDVKVVVAIGVGTAVVLMTMSGVILLMIVLKRRHCHKSSRLYRDTLDSSRRVPEVTIENNLVSYSAPETKLCIRRLRIGRLIGRGAFGQVHAGLLFTSQNNVKKTLSVAVKRLKDKTSEEEGKALQEELEQMILVGHHPNIIQLIGSCLHKGVLHIIMELAEDGDLLTYLRQGKGRHEQYVSVGPDGSLREQQTVGVTVHQDLMLFAWHIAKGMTYLESLKCIHRDLAARNCLLKAGPVAKLSDFGLSRDVYESGYYFRRHKGRVPFKWLSPEALLWGQYSSKSDVWSYGILLWEMATFGGTPYSGVPPDRIAEMHRSRYRLPQPPCCPDSLYRVMRSCWHEDPRKRPRFRMLCDVMETFVQAATEHKYLDLQGHTRAVLPDLPSQESEQHQQQHHPPSPPPGLFPTTPTRSPCSADQGAVTRLHPAGTVSPSHRICPSGTCTISPCPPQRHSQRHNHLSPYSNTPEKQPQLGHLPVKTPPLSVLRRLGWGWWDEQDSGGEEEEEEEETGGGMSEEEGRRRKGRRRKDRNSDPC
ncbi:hypothetical protein ACOMHN_062834 [Nucella lapillus]